MNQNRQKHVLYLSYDGLTDPLGSSQILPYLKGLTKFGYRFTILSFEKPEIFEKEKDLVKNTIKNYPMHWIPLKYHRKPAIPGTVYDIFLGRTRAALLGIQSPIHLVHARSCIAGMIAAPIAKLYNVPFVYDMRGFWADEKVEGGRWHKGLTYKVVKNQEDQLFFAADSIVSLTQAGKQTLHEREELKKKSIHVIPTCVDYDRFESSFQITPKKPRVFTYLGSLTGRYLLRETAYLGGRLLKHFKDSRFEIYSKDDPKVFLSFLNEAGVSSNRIFIQSVSQHAVPQALSGSSLSFSLIKPGYASLASCPTKMAESLATGTPVVANSGIGDCAEIIESEHCGFGIKLTHTDNNTALDHCFERIVQTLSSEQEENSMRLKANQTAQNIFGLREGISRYQRVYETASLEFRKDTSTAESNSSAFSV